jgi:hypothetical protein
MYLKEREMLAYDYLETQYYPVTGVTGCTL